MGIINNPASLQNHQNPHYLERLAELVELKHSIRTDGIGEVKDALVGLLGNRKINVLGVNGGDGTLNGVLNALVELLQANILDETMVPLLMPLNGGTYNIASRAMGTKGNPVATTMAFKRRYTDGIIDDIRVEQLPVLELEKADGSMLRGMVFGSEVISNALGLCDAFGSGYRGLAKLLVNGVTGVMFKTDFLRENAWRFQPGHSKVIVDGLEINAGAVIVSTINLTLVKGLIHSLEATRGRSHFHTKVITTQEPGQIVRLLPNLLWEIPHRKIMDFPRTREIVVWGPFTMDGELYPHQGRMVLRPSDYSFEMVTFR